MVVYAQLTRGAVPESLDPGFSIMWIGRTYSSHNIMACYLMV